MGEKAEGNETDLALIEDCFCPNCKKSHATTTVLPSTIPSFREDTGMSLSCPDCHFQNSEATFGGIIPTKGQRLHLTATCAKDLERQVVKSDSASLLIPQLEFEIPPSTQRGTVTTLEGILKRAASSLEVQQTTRLQVGDLEGFYRCQHVIDKLRQFATTPSEDQEQFPFEVVLDDPSGKSVIENFHASDADPCLVQTVYGGTLSQESFLGLHNSQSTTSLGQIGDANTDHRKSGNGVMDGDGVGVEVDIPKEYLRERLIFSTPCPNCQHQRAETVMCQVDIPYFQQVILMSLVCDSCGYCSREVKPGGPISKQGTRLTLTILSEEDLQREVLLSASAGIQIRDIELEMVESGIGGVYTTVEGLLRRIFQRMKQANPFAFGDSAVKHHLPEGQTPAHLKYRAFLSKFGDICEGKVYPVTVIVDDPLSNSFVGPALSKHANGFQKQGGGDESSLCCHDCIDERLNQQTYDRTHAQNERLGLTDMKTENYSDNDQINYSAENMEEAVSLRPNPDWSRDHPHNVPKAPVHNDDTVMGRHTQKQQRPCR